MSQQEKMLVSIGFDLQKISIQSNTFSVSANTLHFATIKDAKAFFEPQIRSIDEGITYRGNIRTDRNVTISEIRKMLESHSIKLLNDLNKSTISDPLSASAFQRPDLISDDCIGCPPGGGGGATVSMSTYVFWSGYNVTFNWNNNGGVINASDFHSNIVGVTLGVSWTEGTSGFVVYPNSAKIYYTVTGWQNYNIFTEGIGTVFSQPVTITGTYNTNTGMYTMSVH